MHTILLTLMMVPALAVAMNCSTAHARQKADVSLVVNSAGGLEEGSLSILQHLQHCLFGEALARAQQGMAVMAVTDCDRTRHKPEHRATMSTGAWCYVPALIMIREEWQNHPMSSQVNYKK